MNSNEFFVPDIAVVNANTLESQVHKRSGVSQEHDFTSPSNPEQHPILVTKPKPSPTVLGESAKRIVSWSRASTTTTISCIGQDPTQDSLLRRDQMDTPCQSMLRKDSVDQATEDTSLTTQEEEDRPHTVARYRGLAEGTELALNRDWDLAHVGSFVDDEEAINKPLVTPSDDALDTAAARLESILKGAETVLAKLKPVTKGTENGHV